MNDNETKLVETLKKASVKIRELAAENDSLKRQEPIAVVGLSCRFPGGGESPEEFWQLLARGGDAVGEIPRARWDVDRYYDADPDAPGRMYTRSGAFLDNVDAFDAAFFNITPREAEAMDPQQRVLLEMSWAALEDAALDTRKLRGSLTGVFLGLTNYDYIQAHIHSGDVTRITPHAGSGVMFSTAAGRLSYVYDFRGPCLTVDTACSSSLVALHLAMESLQRRESDLALAAGVNLLLSLDSYIALCKVKALATDGRSRAFSDDAGGYGRGEGCAVLVLKHLSDAQRHNDRILAVLRGAAVNHDGRSNGLTAPNGLAQQAVIRKALANAGVEPAAVDYVEAHGTGTILGDPIEHNALAAIFNHPLRIGSVKTNIGHTEAAAGIAGVVKVILSMQHAALPPSIHLGTPNRHIDWNNSPIRVVAQLEEWPSNGRPRIAGVSSFGLSGTNAHVVIEEAPAQTRVSVPHPHSNLIQTGVSVPPTDSNVAQTLLSVLPLSAATPDALDAVIANYTHTLEGDVDLGDVCHTAALRSHLDIRVAAVAATSEEMRGKLEGSVHRRKPDVAAKRGVAFLYTGQGSQYLAMGKELFATEPLFRETIERCEALLDLSIADLLYKRNDESAIAQTAITQPLLFTIQVALTELWKSWGIQPSAVAGHSIGEYAAAYAAGIFTLEAAAKLTAERGRLMQTSARGAMAAVFADEETVRRAIDGSGVVLAGVNAPECITIAGAEEDVARVLESLGDIRWQRLAVSHAFHSPSMQPIVPGLERAARASSPQPASLHFYSTSTGDLALRDVASPSYWSQQLVRPVRFADAVKAMARDGHDLFLELGPGDTLTAFVRRTLDPAKHVAVSSLRKGTRDVATMLDAVATLYVHGQTIDWRAFHAPSPHRRVALPTYPFQRQRHWLDLAPLRKDSIMDKQNATAADDIVSILSGITGLAAGAIDRQQNLMEMGLDSLMLLAMGQKVEKEYGVTLQISQFFQELSTIDDLARYVDEHGRRAATIVPAIAPPAIPSTIATSPVPSNLFEQQLHYYTILCQQQLSEERRAPASPDGVRSPALDASAVQEAGRAPALPATSKTNFRALNLHAPKPLTPEQRAFVDRVVAQHIDRTRGSKALTQEHRAILADWKHTLSFWSQFKEAKYPIVSARSEGPRFWDVDGNEYIDLAIGMGVNFFGHRAPFLHDALHRQMSEGLELGTQSDLTGEVARLIHELTGCERVTFSNTGTEAVMVAIRLARAATKRNKIVLFRDSYHGIFDGVLAAEEEGRIVPIGVGTPPSMVEDVIILDYGARESLDAIARIDDLAAVLVEPVQSRNPDLQPQGFLKKLRRLTRERCVALIFDEMITGFRIHPGGAQAWFGIDADIAVYGKIAGGGLPIGVIAGKAKFLDYIDGGYWEYGDRSGPQSDMIYFGGTFGRNPATMATAHAALSALKEAGPRLQAEVSAQTTRFCDALNWYFEREQFPLRAKHFASQFRLVPLGDADHAQPIELELLWLLLMQRGVYTWERRICFFSTEHGDAEVAYVLDAIRESLAEIRAAGFPFRIDHYAPRQFAAPSSTQRRQYALAQRPGGQLPYHLPQALWIDGPLDVERLEECFREVIARHESLRTSFVMIDGELLLRTSAEPRFEIERHACDEANVDDLALALLQPFDLAVAPLMRVAVIRTSPDRHLLLADTHHIVADGLSFNVIAAEIMAAYEGRELPPVTYDFRECLAIEEMVSPDDEAFWRAQLAGELPVLDLPTDHPRPAERDFRGDHVLGVIDAATTRRLKELARTTHTSLYMLLLAAYDVLLHRLSLQDDLLVGGVVSGRRDPRRAEAVGMFVNTVVFRTRVDERMPFRALLEDVRRNCLDVYNHQDFPFEAMARLNDTRPHDRNALFDTLLSYENASERAFRIRDLRFTAHPFRLPAAMFDLSLEVIEEEGALSLDFAYATSLFTRDTIIRWSGYFARILGSVLEDPDRPIGEIDLIDDDERAFLAAFNDTAAAYPANQSLVDLFEAQVARTPDNVAVVFEENELTYQQLDDRANAVAHALRTRGLGRGDFAGIFLDRSEQTVIAILGILKTGAAYVPLDLDYPAERTAFMIEDSGCRVVLTTCETAERLSKSVRALAVDVAPRSAGVHAGWHGAGPAAVPPDSDILPSTAAARTHAEPAGATPALRCGPDDVAYVIYTSGSTGNPKGCLVTHRNVVRLLIIDRHDFDFHERDVWTIAHSFCFDFSVWEMYGALLYGGRTIVVPSAIVRDAGALHELVRRHKVTVLNQTPGAFQSFIAAERDASAHALDTHLRYVIFGGDRLEPAYLRDWTALYPLDRIALINMYGITETTVHVTYYRLRDGDVDSATGRSIVGRPIPETTVYVCDESMRQRPLGVAGELYVGGSGVSAGYLNRPELTSERFLPSPFRAGERLYRTGDVGRLLPDGTLEHLGRNDHQVQIRGYRVELGEVTQRLLDHPSVDKAFVIDREGANGTRQLVAYLVAAESLHADALRAHLAHTLPSYMVPSHFVQLPSLPLTSNGKVDRKALPSVDDAAIASGTEYTPPRDEVEATIARVWEVVLNRKPIGIHDDYFAHGGDSIMALRIAGRLHQAGLTMELRHLFEARTIAALAPRVLRAERRTQQKTSASLTPIQRWFFETHTRDRHHFNQSVLLRSRDRIDEAALRRALDALQARHELLQYTLEIVETDAIAPHAERVQASFDLDRGPLFRAVVYRLPDGDRLFLVAHHLIIDGVSWRIVLEDLAAAYAGQELPPKSDSYAQWAAVLEEYAQRPELQEEAAYWQAVESVPALSIPADFDSPVNRYGDAETVESTLDAANTEILLTRVHRAHETEINDVLLTALARAARNEYGVAKSRILLEGHGREELSPGADFTATVGWFTSLYPVALDLTDAGAVAEDLCRVRDGLRAIPRKGIGYGILRYLAHTAFRELPEVVFNYLGQFDDDADGAWVLSQEPCGRSQAAALERGALVEIETAVIGGRLRIAVSYNRRIHARATIERFVAAFRAELLQLTAMAMPDEQLLPLTPLQEGMLFHSLEGRSAYFEQFIYRITGDLDVTRFFDAWRALARRHEILRSVIRADGDRPMQVVLRDRTVETTFLRTTAVSRFAEDDRNRGFDLARDPLMRVAVLQTGEREFEVVWSHHHAILDGWSIGILQQELAALYDDPNVALPPAPQYRRFLEWLASRDQSASQRFWSSLLDNAPPPSSIPNLGRANTFTLAEHVFTFDRDTTTALTDLAARLGSTLNSVVQALWSLLLTMYNGEPDVIFGVVVSGRPPELPGVEKMAGLFLQTIPMRARVAPDAVFADLVASVQRIAIASIPHHHYPLSDMQLLTGVTRPLFNHVLVFENYPLDGAAGPRGLQIDNIRAHEQMHYDFSIVVHPRDELEVKFTVNANAIPLAQLAVIEEQWRDLVAETLGARASRPLVPVTRMPSIDSGQDARAPRGVLGLFEEQSRRTPDAIAAEDETGRITYGELNARAEEIAQSVSAEKGEIVPILLPNSIEYIATILAVMKRGAVFAPIAPDQPRKRIESLRKQLTGTLDKSAAYIMFTSGSTGEPKAIIGTHEGLHHFIDWERGELGADASIRVSNLALTTFDVSLRDIFLPLVSGGTVCVPPQAARDDTSRLLRWLADARVTHLHVVPSIFRLLLKEANVPLPDLRAILFAGEPLFGRDVQRTRTTFGNNVALFNLYGPSETTLAKLCYRIPETFDDPARMVPIGTPIAGTRITLTKDGRPVARGAIGELHIEPPFRCVGYLGGNNDAFDGNVYRTGDLARELAGGTIEFIGRRDRQVKVNGVRIELAEVDGALLANPEIDLAVTVAIAQPDGEQALACYYTEKSPIDAATLRARLRDMLPGSMIPSWFIRLDEFPLNANGKIDRQNLPRPEELASGRLRYEAPANEIETRIAAIWAEALGVARIGVASPFLEVGGNSLRAIRIIGRINRELGTALTIRAFFANPTIRHLALAIGGTIAPLPKAAHYAVSHAQRRLWVLDQLGMQPHAYTLPAAFLLEGALDIAALQSALRKLVGRHESLRTTFHEIDGEPRQRVHDDLLFDVPLLAASDADARNFISQPFDLTTGPLFRAAILRLDDERHLLVTAVHHIISDGWSIANMTAEVAELYRGETRPPLRIHYKDFAAWQNALIESDEGRRARDYWHRQLAGPIETLALPLDRPRPAVQSFRGASVVRTIDASLADAVRRFSRDHGGTLFMTFVAVLDALLYRYTGQHDIIAGTAVSNRDREELDGQLGFYVNTLALRQQVDGRETFAALFEKVRDTVTGAIEHSLYPFDRLVQELDIPRDLGRTPIFDVMIVLQDGVQPALTLGDVRVSDFALDWHTAKYTLSFELTEQPDGSIETRLEFDTDLFLRDTIERLGAHFTTLLASAISRPSAPIDDLALLTPAEESILMAPPPVSGNESETIVTKFERIAAAHAQRPAVICDDRVLTYDELNRRSNQLARELANICAPGDFVAVILERAELLVIAFLGILKRGAVYVPIDPSYPAERIAHMLEDSGANVILGSGGLDVASLCDGEDESNPEIASGPHDLAYVIYTSGSTGKPKGVLLEHDGAVALSEAHASIGIEPRHRILQFAPSSFDASVWEILMALMHGATLVIATRQRIADTRELAAYLRAHAVTVATLPPSYLAQLGNDGVETLELLFTAGEPPVIEQALALSRKLRYVNAYGPTETTVCATWHEVDPTRDYGNSIPIGKAIPGAAVYVLDAKRNAVPFGVTGEIYIGGRGVARGYHNRPELTAQSFVGGLYRTGDLGFRLPNGEVVYTGRNDTQVKVRGHRVELGEIEQALLQSDGVQQAVVIARDDDAGAKELVAYLVPRDVDVLALRSQLERRLPAAMIPGRWVPLQQLPLMPNGKIDRARLPVDGESPASAPIEPRNEIERSIAIAWQDVLRRKPIGIHDRFYEAGGDSIRAVRIVNRLRSDGFNVRMLDFLEVPTIAGLAARLSSRDVEVAVVPAEVAVPLTAHEMEGLFSHE